MPTTITSTVRSAGGDYTSLSAWEAGEQADLPTADEISQAECYDFEDTTAVAIDGWTTDATRYIRVYGATGDEAQVPYATNAYRLAVSNNTALGIGENYVRVERIQIQTTATVASAARGINALAASISAAAGDIRIIGCLFRGVLSSTNAAQVGINARSVTGGTIAYRIVNNMFYDWTSSAASAGTAIEIALANGTGSLSYVYNNTIYNAYRGINAPSATNAPSQWTLKNNGFDSNGVTSADGYAAGTGAYHTDSDYNASDLAADAPGANAKNSVSPTFVNEGTRDIHLDSSDTAWKDSGTDLSADAGYAFATDFDAASRSGSWDIGADEVATAASRVARLALSGVG